MSQTASGRIVLYDPLSPATRQDIENLRNDIRDGDKALRDDIDAHEVRDREDFRSVREEIKDAPGSLATRLYGGGGVKGDIPDIRQKLDEQRDWQMRITGALVFAGLAIPIINHFWK